EDDHGPSEGDVPEVGLMEVVVEADQRPLLAVGPVGLHHPRRSRHPLLAERLDEAPPVVAVDVGGDDDDAGDGLGRLDLRHGPTLRETGQPKRRRAARVAGTMTTAASAVAAGEAPAVAPVPSTARATR